MTQRYRLVLRGVIDCAYLVRSRLPRRRKLRVFVEYVRLTLKLLLAVTARPSTERVVGYTVRHFGLGSIHFLFSEIFVRNEYLFDAAGDRPVVFDCGANIGLATLFFKWLYPACEVHAFEPDPDTFAVLKENVERNGLTDVHLYHVALADARGRLDLFVPTGPAGSPLMSVLPGRAHAARRVRVDAEPLSTYAGQHGIDFLKMDVEGVEESVLRELATSGCLENVGAMAVEYHHNIDGAAGNLGSFLRVLDDHGYQYQLDATWGSSPSSSAFQDILVRAHRVTSQPCRSPLSAKALDTVA